MTSPDSPDHQALREMLGAHALGGLDAEATAALEDHLAGCAACRAELGEIAPLAAPLRQVPEDPETGVGTSHPTPAGFAAIRGRIREEEPAPVDDLAARRRRSVPRLLSAAAAAAVIAVAGLGIGYGLGAAGPGRGPDAEPVAVETLDPTVRADAGTIDHTWGVEVVLTASGFAEGQRYEVTILDRTGRPVPAGEFRGTGAAEMVCRLNSSVLRDQAGGFVVTDAEGDEVLRSRFA